MKTTALGFLTGTLMLLSAVAHGLLGWPPFSGILAGAGLADNVIGALAVGWYFGSAAMLVFGGIVLRQAIRHHARKTIQAAPLWLIAVMYLAFGLIAFVARDFNPHFLLFVLTGLLVGLFNFLSSRGTTE